MEAVSPLNRDIDILSIISVLLGYENLVENRQQTAHNDVSSANAAQAAYLLAELDRKFSEQNAILTEILKAVKK